MIWEVESSVYLVYMQPLLFFGMLIAGGMIFYGTARAIGEMRYGRDLTKAKNQLEELCEGESSYEALRAFHMIWAWGLISLEGAMNKKADEAFKKYRA